MNKSDEKYNVSSMLPQKQPFKFVDNIEEYNANNDEVITSQKFKKDSWFFSGHFPGNPVVPGVLLTECMAQSGLLLLSIREDKQVSTGFLIETKRMKFRRLIRPEETLFIHIKFENKIGNYYFVSGYIKNELDNICVKGELVLFLDSGEN